MIAYPVTTKQASFIQSLLSERVWEEEVNVASLSSAEASSLISNLLKAPRKSGQVLDIGMYQTPDREIYRVQASRETGRLYAKHLTLDNGFVYEAGAIAKLKAEDRMTLEAAKAYGVLTGQCCVCGAFLTDENSVAEGIGPVCRRRF